VKATAFYSYKGGLGRTLMVAWTARQLDKLGETVVAIDMDLEAPGLPSKLGFGYDDDLGPGLVDLVLRYQRGDPPPDRLDDWLRSVPGSKNLKILPAGSAPSGAYWNQLAQVQWKELFFGVNAGGGARFNAWLRETLGKETGATHLLVDARTGVTDLGSAAIALFADHVVALVGTSPEGIYGTRAVLRALSAFYAEQGRQPVPMRVVLSRLPASWGPTKIDDERRTIQNTLNEMPFRLAEAINLELPIVVQEEQGVLGDERLAFAPESLRLHHGYSDVLSWVLGAEPGEVKAKSIPADESGHPHPASDALELARDLAARDPERYSDDLVAVLGNEAAAHSSRGRFDEAMELQRESIRLLREKPVDSVGEAGVELANSLINLSNFLVSSARYEEALVASEEAVALRRAQYAARPEAFGPNLAGALNNLGNRLDALGRREEALVASEEAVALRRAQYAARPAAFGPNPAGGDLAPPSE